jgi:hypothetical protein
MGKAAPLGDSSAAKYLFRKRSLNDDELSCHSCGATGAAEVLCVCVCVCVCVWRFNFRRTAAWKVLLQRLVLSVAQISVAPQTQAWEWSQETAQGIAYEQIANHFQWSRLWYRHKLAYQLLPTLPIGESASHLQYLIGFHVTNSLNKLLEEVVCKILFKERQ